MGLCRQILSITLLVGLTACNPVSGGKQASSFGPNFNPGLPPSSNPTPTPEPEPIAGSSTGFKVTPGANRMVGTNGSAKATILTNDRQLVGSNVSGRFSINKTQVR